MDVAEQYDKIYRYCYFRLSNKQLAEDITQETFLRFFAQDINLDNDKKLPYLYKIARNLCIDEYRKKPAEPLDIFEKNAVYDPSDEWLNNLAIKTIIEKLPQDEQELLLLRYVNEISVASICKITGLSRFAVYRKLKRILKQVKEEFERGCV